jgi:hypothetical protein
MFQILNKTSSSKLIAPRRQVAKKNFLFSELGVLCVFARVMFSRFGIQKPMEISNMFG